MALMFYILLCILIVQYHLWSTVTYYLFWPFLTISLRDTVIFSKLRLWVVEVPALKTKQKNHSGLLTLRATGFLSYHHFQKAFQNPDEEHLSNHMLIQNGEAKTHTCLDSEGIYRTLVSFSIGLTSQSKHGTETIESIYSKLLRLL